MPDLAVPPPTSLYPQPPAAAPGLSGNPAQLLDLIGSIAKNTMLQKELAGRQALGQAYQGALNPDGTLDPEKLRSGLADPAASWMLPDAVTHVQSQLGAQFQRQHAQDQAVRDLLGTLDPKNTTPEVLRNAAARLVRMGVPPAIVEGWRSQIERDPRGRKAAIADTQNAAIGSAGTAARVQGPPGAGGEPTTIPLGEATRAGPQGMPTALSADEQKSVESFGRSKEYTGQYSQRILPIQEAVRSVDKLVAKYGQGVFGPGASGRKEFEGFLQTLSPSVAKKIGISGDDLAEFAKAKKYLTQAMSNRNVQLGGHSDQQLAATVSGFPNVEITDLALPDLAHMAEAAMRAEQAQMLEAQKGGGPRYTENLSKWPQRNDVRAFALDRIPQAQRDKLINSLTPDERKRFHNSLQSAYEAGVIDRSGVPSPVTSATSRASAPAAAKPPPKPAVPGVKLGRRADGSQGWFISDPARPGKHLEVMLPGLGQ